MSGKLIGIARVVQKRAPMEETQAAVVSVETGIAGDLRGRRPGRQVTVLFREGWDDACRDLGVFLPWTTRRANLYVEGIDRPRNIGGRISIGGVTLEVTQETKPCMLMEQFHTGLKSALTPDWRAGVCCDVISGGKIQIGDAVHLS